MDSVHFVTHNMYIMIWIHFYNKVLFYFLQRENFTALFALDFLAWTVWDELHDITLYVSSSVLSVIFVVMHWNAKPKVSNLTSTLPIELLFYISYFAQVSISSLYQSANNAFHANTICLFDLSSESKLVNIPLHTILCVTNKQF